MSGERRGRTITRTLFPDAALDSDEATKPLSQAGDRGRLRTPVDLPSLRRLV